MALKHSKFCLPLANPRNLPFSFLWIVIYHNFLPNSVFFHPILLRCSQRTCTVCLIFLYVLSINQSIFLRTTQIVQVFFSFSSRSIFDYLHQPLCRHLNAWEIGGVWQYKQENRVGTIGLPEARKLQEPPIFWGIGSCSSWSDLYIYTN